MMRELDRRWAAVPRTAARINEDHARYMPPIATSVNLTKLNLAMTNSDEGIGRISEDIMRLERGLPTKRQLRLKREQDKRDEQLAKQLEKFSR